LWNQDTNDWEDVLLPNALLRSYQGYGGFDVNGEALSIDAAVAAGNLTLTGVWLVDSVQADSRGMLNVRCRDIGKLLGVQQMYPPLIPRADYPLEFCRWIYKSFDAAFNPRLPTVTGGKTTSGTVSEDVHPRYYDSSTDRWYGADYRLHGHRGSDSVDGNPDTFALSVGNSHPSKDFCTDFFEYEVNGELNEVYVHTWAGNYTMYISVLENGQWVSNGEGDILYDPTELYSSQVTVDTGANIPFVVQTGTGWEEGTWYKLPRAFNAERVRITFRNHTQSDWGPWYYRCGIREVKVRVNTSVSADTTKVHPPADPYTLSGCTYRNPDVGNEEGYWIVADDGQVFAFGDARTHDFNGPYPVEGTNVRSIVSMVATSSGQGYWLLQSMVLCILTVTPCIVVMVGRSPKLMG
jgi:hypothetical protein